MTRERQTSKAEWRLRMLAGWIAWTIARNIPLAMLPRWLLALAAFYACDTGYGEYVDPKARDNWQETLR
jgi:hypothetical protein